MKIKLLLRLLSAAVLVFAVTVPGVFALWSYLGDIPPQKSELHITLMPFSYKPDDVLPQDPEHSENHMAIVEYILNEARYGLNAVYGLDRYLIPASLWARGSVIHCRERVLFSTTFRDLFTPSTAQNIYFVLEGISDNEIALYTMSKSIVDASAVGENVVVYRTVFRKNSDDMWSADETVVGYAPVVGINRNSFMSIEPSTWQKGLTPGQ